MALDKEPRIEWSDIFAGVFIYLGFLLFLVALHLLTINTNGNIQTVLNGVFITFTTIFGIMAIIGGVGIVIQLLRWLAWSINTPNWKKKKGRNEN